MLMAYKHPWFWVLADSNKGKFTPAAQGRRKGERVRQHGGRTG